MANPTEEVKTETVASEETPSISSLAEYRAWKTGTTSEEKEEAGTEEAEESSAGEAEEAESETTGETDSTDAEEEIVEEVKPKSRYNERVQQLVGERDTERQRNAALEQRNRELEAKLNAAANPNSPEQDTKQQKAATNDAEMPQRPKLRDFGHDYDAYEEAVEQYEREKDEYVENQRVSKIKYQEAHAAETKLVEDKLTSGRGKYADFDSVVLDQRDLKISPSMAHTLIRDERGDDIAYYLGKNPKEAERIYNLHPLDQSAALVRLIDRLPKPSISEAKSSKEIKPAFKPPTTVKATGSPTKQLSDARNLKEYRELKKRLTTR